ncbi:MAG TPA: tetratricopeptide repeat protein [Candidatus Cloacimonadota bacterium]|nr:tetratricopeptide repeat protein [Candidatus Cloacimonadota bacterium]
MKKAILVLFIAALAATGYAVHTEMDSLQYTINNLKGTDRINILNQLADVYLTSSPRKSVELSKEAYELASDQKNQNGMAVALNLIGEANFRLGNYQNALNYTLKSITLFSELNDKSGLAHAQENAGLVQLRLYNYDRALMYLQNSLKLEKELNDKSRILELLNHLGALHYDLGNYDEALQFYREALVLEEQTGSGESISQVLHNLGQVYSDRGDYNRSLEFYKRALQMEQDAENTSGIATALFHIGLVYEHLEQYQTALEYLDQSLDLTLEIGSKYEISDTFLHIGNIYTKQNIPDMAFANLTQGIQIAIDINARQLLQDGYYDFYLYYSTKNDTPRALQYFQLFAAERERILTESTHDQLSELQTGYEHLDNEKEIALQQKEQVIGQLVTDKRRLFNLLLICGVIAISSAAGILFFRFRQENIINGKLKNQVIEKENIEKELTKRLAIEKIISSISNNFIKITDFNKVIKLSLENIGRICNASRSSLHLISENNLYLERIYEWQDPGIGMMPSSLRQIEIHKHKWWLEQLNRGEVIHIDNVSMMPNEAYNEQRALEQQGIKSVLAFPINFKERLIGFVGFESLVTTHKWQTEDFALLSLFSETIGLYFERKEMEDRLQNANNILEKRVTERTQELANANQELQLEIAERKRAQQELNDSFFRLKKAMEETINALISAVEIRDPYTAGHQLRVATLSREIGLAMGLDKQQLDSIRIAAILHDIGKIYVPSEILTKPAKLTDTEYTMIKNHPLAGFDILKTIDFDLPVARIVYQHHEKLNGSGYPQGLSGNEIMLEARIVNVADVVDAMISQRPYRHSQGIDLALSELQKYAGIYYDEKVVRVCIDLFNNHGFQFEEIKMRVASH